MGVPLGHKNHRSTRSSDVKSTTPEREMYIYEVYAEEHPQFGLVYKLVVNGTSKEKLSYSKRYIWKCPKWRNEPKLKYAFHNLVPFYNLGMYENLDVVLVDKNGNLYVDGGKTLLSIYYDEDNIVNELSIPEGVECLPFHSLSGISPRKLIIPKSLTKFEWGSVSCIRLLQEIVLQNDKGDFSEEADFMHIVKVKIPHGSFEYYKDQFKTMRHVELEEY